MCPKDSSSGRLDETPSAPASFACRTPALVWVARIREGDSHGDQPELGQGQESLLVWFLRLRPLVPKPGWARCAQRNLSRRPPGDSWLGTLLRAGSLALSFIYFFFLCFLFPVDGN